MTLDQAVLPPALHSDLDTVEAEAIFIIREVAAEFEKPALLFSGGKDSIVLLRIAEKAFWPAKIPFPVVHIDTGHNFPEAIAFRDKRVAELGAKLIVGSVPEAIDRGELVDERGIRASRNRLQTPVLLNTIAKYEINAALGGARRDEEKARAKERVFSFRDDFGQWDPRNQRPELWHLFNAMHMKGEHMRVFPLSNWTELDIWSYIERENLEVPSIYFTHEREVFERDGMLMSVSPYLQMLPQEKTFMERVRYRTVGDMTCTAALRSEAATIAAVIAEVAVARITERGASRADDKFSEAAMEDRKREGYF